MKNNRQKEEALGFLRILSKQRESAMPGDAWKELTSTLKLLHDLPDEQYTVDVITQQIAVPKVTKIVRQYPEESVEAFSEQDVAVILQMLATRELAESAVQLIGLITTYTSRFSGMIQSQSFLEFLAQHLGDFPEDLAMCCFTLLANCCIDCCNVDVFIGSGFIESIPKIPQSFWNGEFLRFLGAIMNSPDLSDEIASELMKVYVICLQGDAPLDLKSDSITYLYNLSRKNHRKFVATRKMIDLLNYIPLLLGTRNKTIVKNTIRLCSEALEHCSDFSILVETSDLLSWLKEAVEFVEFRDEVMIAITNYMKFCQSFDQPQAIELATVPWGELISDGKFQTRLAAIAAVRKLVSMVPTECVFALVTEYVISAVLNILDSTELDARREVYHFVCQLCICEAMQNPDFKSMFVSVVQNSELAMSLEEDVASGERDFVEMAEQTMATVSPLMVP